MPKRVSFLRSPEWKALRQQALERDDHKCCLCGSTTRLNVHHIFCRKFFGDLKLDIDNLLTVCSKCHFRIHKSVGNFEVLLWLKDNRQQQYDYIISHIKL